MILDVIKNRWSPLSFSERPVEEEKLRDMMEAASCAPSSMNEQPWIFIIATKSDSEKFNEFAGFLVEWNRDWAKGAWALIVTLARTRFVYRDRPNRHAFYDTGMAVANMITQAASVDIYAHQMGGFFPEKVKEYFNLPPEIEPVSITAIGYLGDASELSEDLRKRHNTRSKRKNISEFAFRNSFGNPAF
jgi:nitroreductase